MLPNTIDRYKSLREDLLHHLNIFDDEDSKLRGGIGKMRFNTRLARKPHLPNEVEEQLMITVGYDDGYALRQGFIPRFKGYNNLEDFNLDVIKILGGEVGLSFDGDLERKMEGFNSASI